MSELMIGLTLVGFGTSTPELVGGLVSVLAGATLLVDAAIAIARLWASPKR